MSSPAGWYPDPSDPSGLRWWDGQAWGPVAPPQTQTALPQTAVASAEPAAKSSKGIDAVCWAATWVVLISFQMFLGPAYVSSDGDGSGGALAAAVCAVYLAIIGALFVYAGSKSYRLGQQLAVSAFALVTPMLLLSLGLALQWPHISFNNPAEMGAAGLALALPCGLVAGYGVKKVHSGLSAGILLSALLSTLISLGALLGLEDIFTDWGWDS